MILAFAMTNQRKAASDISRIAAQHPKNSIFFSFALNSRAVAERRASPKESLFFFSSTETLLIESHENHGSKQHVSNDIMLFFFSFDTQSGDLHNTVLILRMDRERRKKGEKKRENQEGKRERGDSQFVRSDIFLRLIITQIRSCFLLIRSAVSRDVFKGVNMHKQTHTQLYAQTGFFF